MFSPIFTPDQFALGVSFIFGLFLFALIVRTHVKLRRLGNAWLNKRSLLYVLTLGLPCIAASVLSIVGLVVNEWLYLGIAVASEAVMALLFYVYWDSALTWLTPTTQES